jgi:hypothetical protein
MGGHLEEGQLTFQIGRGIPFYTPSESALVATTSDRPSLVCFLHQCMWKSDFCSVDGAIAGGLDDGQEGREVRI